MLIVLILNEELDVIFIIHWIKRYAPWISWLLIREEAFHLFIRYPSDGRIGTFAVLKCSTSVSDGLTCSFSADITAQNLIVDEHYTVEQASGYCVGAEASTKLSTQISKVEVQERDLERREEMKT